MKTRHSCVWYGFIAILVLAGLVASSAWYGRDQSTVRPAPEMAEKESAANRPSSVSNMPELLRKVEETGPRKSPRAVSSGDRTLPPESAPWHSVYEALQKRAAKGDRQAAVRLFDDLKQCMAYTSTLSQIDNRLASSKMKVSGLSPEVAAARARAQERSLAKSQAILETNQAVCSEVSRDEIEDKTYTIMLQAANAGDPDAATCFVAGGFLESDLDGARFQDYRNNALRLARQGIAAGNWEMLWLLGQSYSGKMITPFNPLARLVEPDSVAYYAIQKLQSLGAQGHPAEARQMQSRIDSILAENELSLEEIAAADSWAIDTYQRSFMGTPFPTGAAHSMCSSD